MLLTDLLSGLLSYLSYIAQPHLLRIVSHPVGWTFLQHLSVNIASHRHGDMTYRLGHKSDGGKFSIEVSSSQVTIGCIKLTIKTNQVRE